jgi:hypothetical protein
MWSRFEGMVVDVPTPWTVISICGLMILYQRYINAIKRREFGQLHVLQKGWVKDASGVKYVSIVSRWTEGGDCVRRWIIAGISLTAGVY